jgi:hypothetical protein
MASRYTEPQPDWLALSAVEAYFSWTEHALIHLAILQSRLTTGTEVATLASGDWTGKFKAAIDLSEPDANKLLDRVLALRQDLRNHVAHDAFGKQGEAFSFHSPVRCRCCCRIAPAPSTFVSETAWTSMRARFYRCSTTLRHSCSQASAHPRANSCSKIPTAPC